MKKTFYPFLVVGLMGACQQQKSTTAIGKSGELAPSASSVPATAEKPLPVLFSAADTLTAPMRELLRTQDLAPLWQHPDTAGLYPNPTFQGFFGPDHYHFVMVLDHIGRAAGNPAVYYLRGRSRYRNTRIRSFSGTLTVRQITDLEYPGFLASAARQSSEPTDSLTGRTYTARAQLQLQEEPTENSGIFEGEALLDFYTFPGQKPGQVYVFDHEGFDDRLPTRGSGLLLRGNRRNISTGQVKPFIVAPDVAAAAPYVFKDFMLDERMGQINPKYAKLGWNDYWRNDEWWAKSPKPKLSL